MKRILAFVLAVVLVFVVYGCNGQKNARKDVFDLVEKNYDAILKACEENDADAISAMDGVAKVVMVDGYILVYCKSTGIAPSSQDYGFYYSEENSPVAVDCNLHILCGAEDMTPEGNGYQCIVDHNTFYTERIKGNLYFYSNAY